jgi:alpha-mannosidase
MFWDAWDIDIYYDDRVWGAEPARSVRVVARGPLRATLEIERKIMNSSTTQRITLQRDSARIDFDTTIDWQERHMLLKAAFPVEILAPTATYEIQWGNVQRATHRNTSWDWARFETCAHKWVDLSEGGYGVSLLNDCKYGHDIYENVIRLSLLRGPTFPNPGSDLGDHHFTYSLLPHAGGWQGETQAEAYALNDPLIVFAGSQNNEKKELEPFVRCNAENIIIETLKQAEDGRGFIVRFYESQRMRGPVRLTAAFQLASVERTNLLEEPQETLRPQDRHVALYVKPYEIVTLRMVPV